MGIFKSINKESKNCEKFKKMGKNNFFTKQILKYSCFKIGFYLLRISIKGKIYPNQLFYY